MATAHRCVLIASLCSTGAGIAERGTLRARPVRPPWQRTRDLARGRLRRSAR